MTVRCLNNILIGIRTRNLHKLLKTAPPLQVGSWVCTERIFSMCEHRFCAHIPSASIHNPVLSISWGARILCPRLKWSAYSGHCRALWIYTASESGQLQCAEDSKQSTFSAAFQVPWNYTELALHFDGGCKCYELWGLYCCERGEHC